MPVGRRKSMNKEKIKESLGKTINSFKQSMPILLGVLLLIALATNAIPKNFYARVFTGNPLIDPFIGAFFGSIAAGNPITSYVIGGELKSQGVSMVAIVAFILSWVTVGVIQLPAESFMLGRRFALIRNLVSFFLAIIISILTVLTLGLK